MNVHVAGRHLSIGVDTSFAVSDAIFDPSASTFDAETTRLVSLARAGDLDAFSDLVTLHQRAAHRVAAAALTSKADADDAVQEACVTAWRQLAQLDDPRVFRAWLLRITWRKALDRRRSIVGWLRRVALKRDEDDDIDADPFSNIAATGVNIDDALLARERDRAVATLIRALPRRLRDPLLLTASAEYRYEDVAALLKIPVGTVKWRVFEARRVLREKLERLGYGGWQ